LYFQLLPNNDNFHGEEVVAFLKELKRHLPRFTVIWDRGNIHNKSGVVRKFLAGQTAIETEEFLGYAPELNADDLVWCWTKYGQLSNYAAPSLSALRERVEAELN